MKSCLLLACIQFTSHHVTNNYNVDMTPVLEYYYASVGGATEAYGSLFVCVCVCVSGAESRKPLKTKRW